MKLIVLLVGAVLVFAGCEEEVTVIDRSQYSDGHIFSFEKGAAIPDRLVSYVEAEYVKKYRLANPQTERSDIEIIAALPRRLLELNLYLREKNPGTLIDNTRFLLPAGGAAVDLGEFVNEGKGSFYIEWDHNFEAYDIEPADLRVFFVSNNHRFAIGNQEYGTGCGKYFEITNFYKTQIDKFGYEVAAADKRYLGQLLGTFYFVVINTSGVYVAATSFLDTRYPKVHCLPPQLGGAYN